MTAILQKYIEVSLRRGLESGQNFRKTIAGGRLELPWKHRKRGRTSTMMHLAKKGVCVFSWIYSGENADALFGQASKQAMQICTTKKYHFPPVKRDIHKMCKNQKGKTGPGEQGALLCWWAGCKLPTASLEECIVFPKTSKQQSYRAKATSSLGNIPWENWKSIRKSHLQI